MKPVIREIRGLNRPSDQRPYSIDQSFMIGALSLAKSLSDLFKEINEDVCGKCLPVILLSEDFFLQRSSPATRRGAFARAHGPEYIKWASRAHSGERDASKANIVLANFILCR